MVCQRPAQPARAPKADGRGGAKGGRGRAAAPARRAGGRSSACKRQKPARRSGAWSSSEGEGDDGCAEEEEEDDSMVSDSEEDEVVVIPDSEGEAPAGAAGAACASLAGMRQRRGRSAAPASDSEGWSSSEDEACLQQRGLPVPAAQQQQQQRIGLPDSDGAASSDVRAQGPAQPLPPTQQAEQRDGSAPSTGAKGGASPQLQAGEEGQFIPTRLIKQRGGSIHKQQVRASPGWQARLLVCLLGASLQLQRPLSSPQAVSPSMPTARLRQPKAKESC